MGRPQNTGYTRVSRPTDSKAREVVEHVRAPVPVGLLGEVEAEVRGQVLVDKLVEAVLQVDTADREIDGRGR